MRTDRLRPLLLAVLAALALSGCSSPDTVIEATESEDTDALTETAAPDEDVFDEEPDPPN